MSTNPRASLRQREASDPSASVWVNANAGSGKTHVLVNRVIRLMLAGADPSRIMCLTFTKAAAAEMANRLFERLSGWIGLDDEALGAALADIGHDDASEAVRARARQLFTLALETPGGLRIQTIHAFCERILQLFPVEAGVVPHFTMLDERAASALLEQARDRVLLEAQSDRDHCLSAALADVVGRCQADRFGKLMAQLLGSRAELAAVLEPGRGLALAESVLRQSLGLTPGDTAATIRATLQIDRESYRRLAEAFAGGGKTDRELASLVHEVLAAPDATLEGLRLFFLNKEDGPRKAASGSKGVKDRNPWIEEFVEAERRRLISALGRLADLERMSATLSLLRLGSAIVAGYAEAKRRQGAYDFDDLIIRTAGLLRDRPDASWVLFKLDGGIEHVLVDEAQDTSPAQWEIIRSLTEEFFAGSGRPQPRPRTLFVVGDRKQSIFSFQGADPDVFEAVRADFADRIREGGGDFRPVDFTVSFRSVPEILKAVDLVFPRGSDVRKGLDGETEGDWDHESNRPREQGVVEVWPLVEPLENEPEEPWQAPLDRAPQSAPHRRLAAHLAATIRSWIGRRVIAALGRTVQPGDVLVLVRRRNALFDALIRALWAEGVPVAGADRLRLGENLAVKDLLALAQFAVVPEDDHALACVLKSPLITQCLDEDQLFTLAWNRSGQSLWQRLRDSDDATAVAAAAQLSPLVDRAGTARPFEFFADILVHARMRILSRLGSEANDAIDALLDLALAHEQAHPTSLAGFVNWFLAAETEIRRNMEQGTGEVRIMTVHGAKGLEAPIVILPDTVAMPDTRTADPLLMLPLGNGTARVPLWPISGLFESEQLARLRADRDQSRLAEYRRLLYVAMTRARDELYVCGYHGRQRPRPECWYHVIRDGLSAVLEEIGTDEGWRFGAPPVFTEDAGARRDRPRPMLPDWLDRPAPGVAARTLPHEPAPRSAQQVARGILVHRLLQQAMALGQDERASYITQAVARAGHDASLARHVMALIANPAFAEVFHPDGLSEVPLLVMQPDGTRERRQIDRLVMTPHDLLLVDYKTDRDWPREPSQVNPEYLAQLAAYRAALRRIHGPVPLRLALLWTEAPALMVIPDRLLDAAADQLSVNRT